MKRNVPHHGCYQCSSCYCMDPWKYWGMPPIAMSMSGPSFSNWMHWWSLKRLPCQTHARACKRCKSIDVWNFVGEFSTGVGKLINVPSSGFPIWDVSWCFTTRKRIFCKFSLCPMHVDVELGHFTAPPPLCLFLPFVVQGWLAGASHFSADAHPSTATIGLFWKAHANSPWIASTAFTSGHCLWMIVVQRPLIACGEASSKGQHLL